MNELINRQIQTVRAIAIYVHEDCNVHLYSVYWRAYDTMNQVRVCELRNDSEFIAQERRG